MIQKLVFGYVGLVPYFLSSLRAVFENTVPRCGQKIWAAFLSNSQFLNQVEYIADETDTLLPAPHEMPPGDYGAAFIKMFVTLFALVALLGISLWFVRRLLRYRLERGTGSQRMIEVLEKKMISQKTMIYVLEIEGEKIILAESQLEIKKLNSLSSCADQTQNPDHN